MHIPEMELTNHVICFIYRVDVILEEFVEHALLIHTGNASAHSPYDYIIINKYYWINTHVGIQLAPICCLHNDQQVCTKYAQLSPSL